MTIHWKNTLAAVCFAVFLGGPAIAETASATIEAAFGNTVAVTDGDTQYTVFYNADGTFQNSLGMSGTWALTGDTLTLSVDGAEIGSTSLPAGKAAGDAFEMTDQTGKTVQVSIVPGRN